MWFRKLLDEIPEFPGQHFDLWQVAILGGYYER